MLPKPSSLVSHKINTSRVCDVEDWPDRTSRADHTLKTCVPAAPPRPTRPTRPSDLRKHEQYCCLRWRGARWNATAVWLDVPKVMATAEKSVTKLFASAVRRLPPSVNVQRCYLVPAGVRGQTG